MKTGLQPASTETLWVWDRAQEPGSHQLHHGHLHTPISLPARLETLKLKTREMEGEEKTGRRGWRWPGCPPQGAEEVSFVNGNFTAASPPGAVISAAISVSKKQASPCQTRERSNGRGWGAGAAPLSSEDAGSSQGLRRSGDSGVLWRRGSPRGR